MVDVASLARLADGAVVWSSPTRARVRVRGADARSFLHRLSTNAVADLAAGQGRLNAFCTDKGRLVDVVLHLTVAADDVLLIGGADKGAALVAWLDKYLFSEKVELVDASTQGAVVEVAGARAPVVVDALVAGASSTPTWGFAQAGARVAARAFPRVDAAGVGVPSFVVVDADATQAALTAAVQAAGATLVDDDAADVARVAAGAPAVGREIVDKHNPLDLELHDAVSWTKGCYIGQEVVARLDTYQKQARRLMALVVDGAAPGDAILVDGAAVGEITSVAPARWGDRPSALGMVRSKESRDEIAVQLKRADGSLVAGRAVVRAAAQRPHD